MRISLDLAIGSRDKASNSAMRDKLATHTGITGTVALHKLLSRVIFVKAGSLGIRQKWGQL